MKVVDGQNGIAQAGATVGGATTGADGQATLSFADAGIYRVKAERADAIRSNTLVVCVDPPGADPCTSTDKAGPSVAPSLPGRRLASERGRSRTLLISWQASDANGAGVSYYSVDVRELHDGVKASAVGDWEPLVERTALTGVHFRGDSGSAYQFRITAVDRAANRTAIVTDPLVLPVDDRDGGLWKLSGDWKRSRSASAWGHTVVRAERGRRDRDAALHRPLGRADRPQARQGRSPAGDARRQVAHAARAWPLRPAHGALDQLAAEGRLAPAASADARRRAGRAGRGGAAAVRRALLIAGLMAVGAGSPAQAAPPKISQLVVFRDGSAQTKTAVSTRATKVSVAGRRCTAGRRHGARRAGAQQARQAEAARLRQLLAPGERRRRPVRPLDRRRRQPRAERLGLQGRPARGKRRRRRPRRARSGAAGCAPASASPGSTAACATAAASARWSSSCTTEAGTLIATVRGYDDEGNGVAVAGADGDAPAERRRRPTRPGSARLALPAGQLPRRWQPRPGWSARSRSASRCREAGRRAARRRAAARRLRLRPGEEQEGGAVSPRDARLRPRRARLRRAPKTLREDQTVMRLTAARSSTSTPASAGASCSRSTASRAPAPSGQARLVLLRERRRVRGRRRRVRAVARATACSGTTATGTRRCACPRSSAPSPSRSCTGSRASAARCGWSATTRSPSPAGTPRTRSSARACRSPGPSLGRARAPRR